MPYVVNVIMPADDQVNTMPILDILALDCAQIVAQINILCQVQRQQ